MAGSSLLVLLDDIAAVLDDVALMTKVAAKKTAGVLGDDLAVNAEQVAGVRAERELPVVWAVARGSLRNKCILVPAALAISLVIPWLITPLLMLGGLFLCYEGFEKVAHALGQGAAEQRAEHRDLVAHLADPAVDLVAFERDKIRGAIRTDLILSAEIIVLTLGVVSDADMTTQVLVLSGVALLMTVGVYGVVAAIVKLDDAGVFLAARQGSGLWPGALRTLGRGLVTLAPKLMKTLSVVGTAAMFMVGGGILLHGFNGLDLLVRGWAAAVGGWAVAGPLLAASLPALAGMLLGLLAGAAVVGAIKIGARVKFH